MKYYLNATTERGVVRSAGLTTTDDYKMALNRNWRWHRILVIPVPDDLNPEASERAANQKLGEFVAVIMMTKLNEDQLSSCLRAEAEVGLPFRDFLGKEKIAPRVVNKLAKLAAAIVLAGLTPEQLRAVKITVPDIEIY